MNQLTLEQIKILENAFASYPKDFPTSGKYTSMQGIENQLDVLRGKVGLIWFTESAKLYDNKKYYVKMGKLIVNIK
jgi:hypothetical protein